MLDGKIEMIWMDELGQVRQKYQDELDMEYLGRLGCIAKCTFWEWTVDGQVNKGSELAMWELGSTFE
jgi:hypothetical protein